MLASAIRKLIDSGREWLDRHRVHFLYVGDGALAPKVRETLGPGVGAPYVTLAGMRPQADTPSTLAASDILLSPHVPNPDGTPFFGSPTKLFEYMAMAKPIVASDLDQIGWVLKGWRPGRSPARRSNGYALAARSSSSRAVSTRWSRGSARRSRCPAPSATASGSEARRLVVQSFTWDRNVAAVLDRLRAAGPAPGVGCGTGGSCGQTPGDRGSEPELAAGPGFWQAAACGEVYARGTSLRERLQTQARARYTLEPYLRPFARFADGRGRDVLEIGVGMGADHLEWARSTPRSLTGIDLTSHAIEFTRRAAAAPWPDAHGLLVTNTERLPFQRRRFDLVYSWGVIHHSPDTPRRFGRSVACFARVGARG